MVFFSHGKTNSCRVAIGYYGKKSFELLNKVNDKLGRVLIIEVKIENKVLSLINLCNANTENERLSTLSDLSNVLEKSMILITNTLYLEEILIYSLKLN